MRMMIAQLLSKWRTVLHFLTLRAPQDFMAHARTVVVMLVASWRCCGALMGAGGVAGAGWRRGRCLSSFCAPILRYISVIQSSGSLLLNIVNDILDFSRITSDDVGFKLSASSFDPRALAVTAARMFVPQVRARPALLFVRAEVRAFGRAV